ncbi:MAG: heme o synthase [Actinomycetes bacterium]
MSVTALDSRQARSSPGEGAEIVGEQLAEAASGPHRPRRVAARAGARVGVYLALTKPRNIELLLVTTIPTMILADRGFPSAWLILATLVGGSLSAGGANTLNSWYDRDIDAVMHRTGRRPLATGAVTARAALIFGAVLSVIAVAWMGALVNWLSAGLSAVAIAFYVGVYTMVLKRHTPSNIVWGGAAGCMPVLIGWAAVTGRLAWTPLVLFAIIFSWTPPHYWPLSMKFREDYAAAGVPMLPVVAEASAVARHIVVYAWVMVGFSLLLWPVGRMSVEYAAVALVLGAAFLVEAYALRRRVRSPRRGDEPRPMRLFHFSITYLSLLFVAIAIDPLLFAR